MPSRLYWWVGVEESNFAVTVTQEFVSSVTSAETVGMDGESAVAPSPMCTKSVRKPFWPMMSTLMSNRYSTPLYVNVSLSLTARPSTSPSVVRTVIEGNLTLSRASPCASL